MTSAVQPVQDRTERREQRLGVRSVPVLRSRSIVPGATGHLPVAAVEPRPVAPRTCRASPAVGADGPVRLEQPPGLGHRVGAHARDGLRQRSHRRELGRPSEGARRPRPGSRSSRAIAATGAVFGATRRSRRGSSVMPQSAGRVSSFRRACEILCLSTKTSLVPAVRGVTYRREGSGGRARSPFPNAQRPWESPMSRCPSKPRSSSAHGRATRSR